MSVNHEAIKISARQDAARKLPLGSYKEGFRVNDIQWAIPSRKILEERYLIKDEHGAFTEDPNAMCMRVAKAVAEAENKWPLPHYESSLPKLLAFDAPEHWKRSTKLVQVAGKVNMWQSIFFEHIATQRFMPNTPTLLNAGTNNGQQLSACFVLPVGDSIPEIFEAIKNAALIHQSSGGCLRKGALVATTKGLLPIEKVQEGDTVYTLDRRTNLSTPAKVKQTHIYNVENAYEVVLEGGRKLTTSAWHPFMVFNGLKTVEKRADEIDENDYVLVPSPTEPEQPIGSEHWHWLVGFFVGDGHFTHMADGKVNVGFSVNSVKEQLAVNAALDKHFGKTYAVDESGTVPMIRLQGRAEADKFLSLFEGSESKLRLPDSMHTPATIAGLFDADASCVGNQIQFETISPLLASQVAGILNWWGISSDVRYHTSGNKSRFGATSGYRVTVNRTDSFDRFREVVGPYLKRLTLTNGKYKWTNVSTNASPELPHIKDGTTHIYRWEKGLNQISTSTAVRIVTDAVAVNAIKHSRKVKSVVKVSGGEDFYDLTVEGHETYAAGENGLMFVHNTGFSFTELRPKGSLVKKSQGVASGPVSFMKIFNAATNEMKQGGKRRGANMAVLSVHHPDILDFIECKLPDPVTGIRDITNFNVSVAATDVFMAAVRSGDLYDLIAPHTGKVVSQLDAREVFVKICQSAWQTGDPGLLFIDKANNSRSNPIPEIELLQATNPCFRGNTLIPTDKGLISIQELAQLTAEGGSFQVHVPGKGPKPAHAFSTGVQKIYRLHLTNGSQLDLTGNHKLVTAEGEKVEVRKLTNKTRIKLDLDPIHVEICNDKGDVVAEVHPEPTFVGWVMGGGTLVWEEERKMGLLGIGYKREDAHIARGFHKMLEDRFGSLDSAEVSTFKGDRYVRDYYKSGVVRFAINDLGLDAGRRRDDLPYLDEDKSLTKIPQLILRGAFDTQMKFLQGLFSSAACFEAEGNDRRLLLVKVPEGCARDTQQMLFALGIRSHLACTSPEYYTNGTVPEYRKFSQWTLTIRGRSLVRYIEQIGFCQNSYNFRMGEAVLHEIMWEDLTLEEKSLLQSIEVPEFERIYSTPLRKYDKKFVKGTWIGRTKSVVDAQLVSVSVDSASSTGFSLDLINKVLEESPVPSREEILSRLPEEEFVSIKRITQLKVDDSIDGPQAEVEVFNITVDEEEHIYCVGGLVSANCGEQWLGPYDACNLGSINLGKFFNPDGEAEDSNWDDHLQPGEVSYITKARVDWEALKKTTWDCVRFLDDVIDINPFPIPQVELTVKSNRRIGLGVMGWADLLFRLRLSYSSPEACSLGEMIMTFINRESERASEYLAIERKEFPNWSRSIYKEGPKLRNGTRTTVAPTGTISIIADCSSGIEPVFAVAFQHVVDRGLATERRLNMVNSTFKECMIQEDLWSDTLEEYVSTNGTVHGFNLSSNGSGPTSVNLNELVPHLPDWVAHVFVSAHEVSPQDHLNMQAAFQRGVDNSISKTINLPNHATPQQIEEVYLMAYELDCKGITVFRDGCLSTGQVLNVGKEADQVGAAKVPLEDQPGVVHGVFKKGILAAGIPVILKPYSGDPEERPIDPEDRPIDHGKSAELLEAESKVIALEKDAERLAAALAASEVRAALQPKNYLPMVRELPAVMNGQKRRIHAPEGTVHLVINEDTLGPAETFVTLSKAGSDVSALAEAMGRLISLVLRLQSSLSPIARMELVIGQLENIGGSGSVGFGAHKVRSLPDAVAHGLRDYLLDKHFIEPVPEPIEFKPQATSGLEALRSVMLGNSCPQCGNSTAFVLEEGCKKCHDCGYSEC